MLNATKRRKKIPNFSKNKQYQGKVGTYTYTYPGSVLIFIMGG